VRVVRGDALKFAAGQIGRFDLIFLDPPYRAGWLERRSPLVPLLPPISHPGTLIYAEAERALDSFGPWQTLKAGVAGQVHYHLLTHADSPPELT
jgi:16S rRNA (guanine966-N2)-methyltransferase